MYPIAELQNAFYTFLARTYPEFNEHKNGIVLTLQTDPKKVDFGDLSSNAPLLLARPLRKNPAEIAKTICSTFTHPSLEKIEPAGPGFLNMWLSEQAFQTITRTLFAQKQSFFKPTHLKPRSYCIEFVSANPTGPLHLGHGRGGILGDVLSNVLRFVGHQVTKEYYINDAGNQIQKLGNSLFIRCQQEAGIPATMPEDGYHGEYLIEMAKECIAQFSSQVITQPLSFFAEYAQTRLLKMIEKTLQDYGITFDVWFSERTLHDTQAVKEAVDNLLKVGAAYTKDGAIWFKATDFGDDKDRVLKRAEGDYTYIGADAAYLINKLERGFDTLIMTLGQDHHSYVIRLKSILKALGKNPDQLNIILYQLVTLKEDGAQVRMSKRAGTMITLQDVIDTVGTDVARFFYLHRKPEAHLEFDIGLALKKTEENPLFYIQYAYVRTRSILRKAAEHLGAYVLIDTDISTLDSDSRLLLKKVCSLKSILESITHNYHTHLLAYYAYELAQEVHRFYTNHRIILPDDKALMRHRLILISIASEALRLCLQLLGVSAPEHM